MSGKLSQSLLSDSDPLRVKKLPRKKSTEASVVSRDPESSNHILNDTPTQDTVILTSTPTQHDANPSFYFKEFENVKNHSKFIQLLVNAKATADMTQDPSFVTWRGYKASVKPNLPAFTKDYFRLRLKEALKSMKELSVQEVEVN